jgi:hypothetical protein
MHGALCTKEKKYDGNTCMAVNTSELDVSWQYVANYNHFLKLCIYVDTINCWISPRIETTLRGMLITTFKLD